MHHESIVETRYGKVRGTASGPVTVWKGIPYARPPVGSLRFQPPQPPQAWTGVREATAFGAVAPQDIERLVRLFEVETETREATSEDCLYLNIWSPGADDARRPVMVWIHGGAFVTGSGSQKDYDGASFAEQGDVVVVTLNYRLGMLGFLHLGEIGDETYASSGNCGLLDQIAALRWVQENIAALGGDPTNVTVFGESAGAMSIGSLLAMPAARGLFQRAILESGAAHSVHTAEVASRYARDFLKILKIGPDQLASLRDLPYEKLIEAQSTLLAGNALSAVRPVIDGKDIPVPPIQAIAGGAAREVAILIGTNREEMKLFISKASASSVNANGFQQMLGEKTPQIFGTYALARPGAEMYDIGIDIFTDFAFRIPAIRLAEQQVRQGARVWMYRFDWPSPDATFDSCHALELPFVWNKLGSSTFRALLGTHPPQGLTCMHFAWIAFARTGDPNIPALPTWSPYETTQRETMLFNEACSIVNDPQGAERIVWEGVL